MQAYVLLKSESGGRGIARKLRSVAGVILAEDLVGPYAAIALARSGENGSDLQSVIAEIRQIPGVTAVFLMPVPSAIDGAEGRAA